MTSRTAVLVILLVVLAAPTVARAADTNPLAIVITTRIAPEPGEVLVRTRIEPDARSRELTIEWWTPDGVGGSHLITLEGDRAAKWHSYYIKRMEAGEYEVAAVLKRSDGSELRRKLTVTVIGEGVFRSASSPISASK